MALSGRMKGRDFFAEGNLGEWVSMEFGRSNSVIGDLN